MVHTILYIVIGSLSGIICGALVYRAAYRDFGEVPPAVIVGTLTALFVGVLWPIALGLALAGLFLTGAFIYLNRFFDKAIDKIAKFKKLSKKLDEL